MALDVMVMPLWRFKADDVTSPIEETLGIKPEIISLSAPPQMRPPWYLRVLERIGLIEFGTVRPDRKAERARVEALKEVESVIAVISKETGCDVRWPDEGVMHYCQQFHGVPVLRAFAAWTDHRDQMPLFECPPEGSGYREHPVWKLPRPEKPTFPLLLTHSLHVGYFLPAEFEGCHQVEPFKIFGQWDAFHDVASTPAVLREVEALLEIVNELPAAELMEDPCQQTRIWAEELRKICALSIEHRLPVIFYG